MLQHTNYTQVKIMSINNQDKTFLKQQNCIKSLLSKSVSILAELKHSLGNTSVTVFARFMPAQRILF